MAKITPMVLVENMSGKVCTHSDVYFRTAKRSGKVFTGKLCNPSTKAATAGQMAVRNMFATAVTNTKAILAAKSTDSPQTNYNKQLTYQASYAAHKEFAGTLYNWVLKKEFEVLQAEAMND